MKISVVMTTYNGSEFITEQLDSIREQTIQPDEVIIVDDASTDKKTPQIIKQYIDKFSLSTWVLYENTVNKGWRKNFIDAMDMASGDVVFLSDQDDVWFKTKIEHMTRVMELNEKIMVLACKSHRFVSNENIICGEENLDIKKVYKVNLDVRNFLIQEPGCAICYRNSFFKSNANFLLYGWPHDAFLWLISVINGGLYILNQEEFNFRRHENAATSKKDFSLENRVKRNEENISQLKKVLSADIEEDKKLFIEEYLNMIELRAYALKNKNIFSLIKLFVSTSYYHSIQTLVGDMISIIRG